MRSATEVVQRNNLTLDQCSYEILFSILIQLTPEQILSLTYVCMRFNKFIKTYSSLWNEKLQIHFPFENSLELAESFNIDGFKLFWKIYSRKYRRYASDNALRFQFSLIKENKINELLDTGLISIENNYSDDEFSDMLSVAGRNNNQQILNHLYSVFMENINRIHETRDDYKINKEFILALRCKQPVELVTKLIQEGLIHEPMIAKTSYVLRIVANNGSAELLQLLLESGADINNRDHYTDAPIHIAVINRHHHLIDIMIKYSVYINQANERGHTALHIAAKRNDPAMTLKLLDCNANPFCLNKVKETALDVAVKLGYFSMVEFYYHKFNSSAQGLPWSKHVLHHALKSKSKQMILKLIVLGAGMYEELKAEGTILHAAAREENTDMLAFLLQKNLIDVNHQDKSGKTALHVAASSYSLEAVSLLIANKADVNAVSGNQLTPLHKAVIAGRVDIAKLLLDHHANINAATESDQCTALHYAAGCNWNIVPMVKLLLEYKADKTLVNAENETPLGCAVRAKNIEIASILEPGYMPERKILSITRPDGTSIFSPSLKKNIKSKDQKIPSAAKK